MDCNHAVNRIGTTSVKWNHLADHFQTSEDALPLWVADMDFACAEPIQKALKERLLHPIYGYESAYDDEYVQAIQGWFQKQFHWFIEKESMFFSPGVVPAIGFLIDMLSEPNDGIVIQTPVYHPFANKIKAHQRKVVENPLICENGYYHMDFLDLEAKLKIETVKGIILCNPHNPVGRVWKEAELKQLVALAKKYQKWIISDEIHCDLIRKGYQHLPLANICSDYQDEIITCTAPSKTFNLAALQNSNIMIHKESYRKKWQACVIDRYSISGCNTFGKVATIAAYRDGEQWLREVNAYIDENFAYLEAFLKQYLPNAILSPCEGTYLAWVNFNAYVKDEKELEYCMHQKAHVVLNEGYLFGDSGKGYERINLACTHSLLKECLQRIYEALVK